MLALHGRSSNSDITKLQLENLQLLSDDIYDITYLHGPVNVSGDIIDSSIAAVAHGQALRAM